MPVHSMLVICWETLSRKATESALTLDVLCYQEYLDQSVRLLIYAGENTSKVFIMNHRKSYPS